MDGVTVKASESESQKLLSGAAVVGLVACATVVGKRNAANPPLASRGQQRETRHLGAKSATAGTAGTAGMQVSLEDTVFDQVDRTDTLDNQDADFDVDGE